MEFSTGRVVICFVLVAARLNAQEIAPPLAASPHVRAAQQILAETQSVISMLETPERVGALLSLAHIQADVDDLAGAEATMLLASSSGVLPENQHTSFTWTALALAETRAGRPREALEKLLARWGRPSAGSQRADGGMATRAIVEELVRIGDVPAALALAPPADYLTYEGGHRLVIAEMLGNRGQFRTALDVLVPGSRPEDSRRLSDHALQLAANLHGALGNLSEAARLANMIRSPSLQFETLLVLPGYHARHGDMAGAREQLLKLLPGGGGHPPPEAFALPPVIHAQIVRGDIEGAIATGMMFASRAGAEEHVINVLVERKEIAQALQLFATTRVDPDAHSRLIYRFAKAHIEAGDLSAASVWVERVALPISRESLMTSIAAILAKRGDVAGAHRTAASITDPRIRGEARFEIAVVQATLGDVKPLLSEVAAAHRSDRLSMLLRALKRVSRGGGVDEPTRIGTYPPAFM